jgi:sugar O-acyltransferase (sialic acid O-acetyltransferase NeuD family)
MKHLLIVGAGGHGRAVAEAVIAAESHIVIGFIDDAYPELRSVLGFPVLGTTAELVRHRSAAEHVIVAIGNNTVRRRLTAYVRELEFVLESAFHPRATISPSASIGSGSAVMAGAIVGPEAVIGEGVIVNCGAVVDHHCRVEAFGHLGVNAAMAGGTVLGVGAWMQAGSALGYGAVIDAGRVVGVGVGVNAGR